MSKVAAALRQLKTGNFGGQAQAAAQQVPPQQVFTRPRPPVAQWEPNKVARLGPGPQAALVP